jgi:hypothetical protein
VAQHRYNWPNPEIITWCDDTSSSSRADTDGMRAAQRMNALFNLDRVLAYLTVVFRAFPQSIEENAGMVTSHMSQARHQTSLPIHGSQASYHNSLTSNS